MSANFSSPSTHPLLHPNFSFSVELCFNSKQSSLLLIPFFFTSVLLLLPLCILVLCLGLRRCQQHLSSPTVAGTSHSDSFTYHMVAMELIGVSGSILICCGIYSDYYKLVNMGFSFWSYTWFGEVSTHCLTSLEGYLAVVHPITYLNLKNKRGVRIRNICIVCVWLLCLGMSFVFVSERISLILYFLILSSSMIFISFCGFSILCVLVRPRPGEESGASRTVDKLKQKAFFTVIAILVVLLLKVVLGNIMAALFIVSGNKCVIFAGGIWFNLPSSLLLPLFFLQKAGLPAFCIRNAK